MIPADHPRDLAAAAALASHAQDEGTALLSLTDEELLALTGDGTGIDLPWIDGREGTGSAFSREEARLSAGRSLLARGLLAPESAMAALESRDVVGDPEALTTGIVVAGILARRRMVPWEIRVDGPEQDRVAIVRLFVDHDGTVLHELVSPDGLHHFAVGDVPHSQNLLRGRLGQVPDGAPASVDVVHGTWSDIEASEELGPVLAAGTVRSRLVLSDHRTGEAQTLLLLVGPQGAVLTRESSAEQQEPALEAVLISREDLDHLLVDMFTVPPTA